MAVETDRSVVPTWVRYGGIVIIIASLLEILTTVLTEFVYPEALIAGTRDAAIVGDIVITYLILGTLGVVALYVGYGDSFGWIGNVGLLAIAIGALIGVATVVMTGSLAGDLLNFILVFGGAALLAIGLWRAPEIPRIAAALMALAPVVAVIGIAGFSVAPDSALGPLAFVALNFVWGAAWIILGYNLWTEPHRG